METKNAVALGHLGLAHAVNDDEAFSRSLRGRFTLNYQGNYGPLVSLPPQYNLTAAVDHGNERGLSLIHI